MLLHVSMQPRLYHRFRVGRSWAGLSLGLTRLAVTRSAGPFRPLRLRSVLPSPLALGVPPKFTRFSAVSGVMTPYTVGLLLILEILADPDLVVYGKCAGWSGHDCGPYAVTALFPAIQ
jgi:hypothetical protein